MKIELIQLDINEPFYKIDGVLYDKYQLLALASKLAPKSKKDALLILKMAEELYSKFEDENFDELCYCVHMFIIYENMNKDELYYQDVFKNNCQRILGDEYELYDKKNLKRKRLDAWVVKNNVEQIPVEMKLHCFGDSALKQLLNYMDLYECDNGIAIGESCNVELPNNIMFVELSKVKEFDNY